jgi:hypothetical protein
MSAGLDSVATGLTLAKNPVMSVPPPAEPWCDRDDGGGVGVAWPHHHSLLYR